MLWQHIIDGHNRPAWIAEDRLHALALKGFQQEL